MPLWVGEKIQEMLQKHNGELNALNACFLSLLFQFDAAEYFEHFFL